MNKHTNTTGRNVSNQTAINVTNQGNSEESHIQVTLPVFTEATTGTTSMHTQNKKLSDITHIGMNLNKNTEE
jgi:hypothetical protein